MMNLVEKYTTDEVVANEEGVVAIEYVIVAAAIVVALGGIWTLFGDDLSDKLGDIVDNI
jgi:Flp pilus assembly pilin Flp